MASLVGIVFPKHILKNQSLISLQMSNKFTKCLIFMFKIPMIARNSSMDVNMITNTVKYDTNKRWVIHNFSQ
jgi:hypothetical protein